MSKPFSHYSWTRKSYNFNERAHFFFNKPWIGGIILFICVIVAMLLANMEWSSELYHSILETDLSITIHSKDGNVDWVFPHNMTVEKFINDGLMVIFFFSVGLEIKREIVHGQLSSFSKSILPIVAAVGGMIIPALIYFSLNYGTAVEGGWGIPMATDIAFAIGIMSLMGSRVPISLKIFLTALAIVDDLGAIIVIALFYGGSINWLCLFIAFGLMVVVFIMNRMNERRMFFYIVPAIIIWSLFYYSGVHATLSGVVMAMLIPMEPRYNRKNFIRQSNHIRDHVVELEQNQDLPKTINEEYYNEDLRRMWKLSHGSEAMSQRLESTLAPYVTYLVIPIFALANAGVIINFNSAEVMEYAQEVGMLGAGIFAGLVIGKPLGIFLFSWIAIKLKIAAPFENVKWGQLLAISCFGGIGFTMSIFVDTLAFGDMSSHLVNLGKIAILLASIASAIVGVILVMMTSKKKRAN